MASCCVIGGTAYQPNRVSVRGRLMLGYRQTHAKGLMLPTHPKRDVLVSVRVSRYYPQPYGMRLILKIGGNKGLVLCPD